MNDPIPPFDESKHTLLCEAFTQWESMTETRWLLFTVTRMKRYRVRHFHPGVRIVEEEFK